MARPLTNDELVAAIEREEKAAYGFFSGELAEQRQVALDYYFGEQLVGDDDIPDGRSKVISTDVSDTVEWILPSLLKIFLSGDEVVRFDPKSPEDIPQAEQETAYINHIATAKNESFSTFHSWFKDALIQKVGYVKTWYEEKKEVVEETYEGMSDEEFAMLMQDDDVTPIEHTEETELEDVMGPQGPMQIPITSHDIKVRRESKTCQIKFEAVPPEEIFVSTEHREVSLQNAPFVEHKTRKTVSYLRQIGYDVPDDINDGSEDNTEDKHRDRYDEWKADNQGADPSMRQVWVRDVYIRIDKDGDGIAELRRVVVVGKTVLEDKITEEIPFAALCPVPMPHRHVGLSYADLIMDLQDIKSMFLRLAVDNGYLAANGRWAVSDRVNLDDMLVSRPGGIVRVDGDPNGAMLPMVSPQSTANQIQMIEYLDAVKENRTGVTKYNQGLDSNSLNKTATGINQIMNAAQQRIELIARLFAEGGVKQLFLLIHGLVRRHENKEQIVQIRNQWVPINPREWVKRTDLSISVGLGTGNKNEKLGHLVNAFQMSANLVPLGIVNPVNMYNLMKEVYINAGFKDPEKFLSDPSQMPPMPPQPNPLIQVEQIKQQGKAQELQINAQLEQQKAQAQLQQEQLRSQNDVAIERDKLNMQAELERYKAQLQADTELAKTKLQLEAEIQIEQFKAQNDSALELQKQRMELNSIVDKASQAQGNEATGTIVQGLKAMIQSMNAPKQVVRDESGRVVGVQTGNAE